MGLVGGGVRAFVARKEGLGYQTESVVRDSSDCLAPAAWAVIARGLLTYRNDLGWVRRGEVS